MTGLSLKSNPAVVESRPNPNRPNANAADARARARVTHLKSTPVQFQRMKHSWQQPRNRNLPMLPKTNAPVHNPLHHTSLNSARKSILNCSRKWLGRFIWPRSVRKAWHSSATMMRKTFPADVSVWRKFSSRNNPADVRRCKFRFPDGGLQAGLHLSE